MSDIFFPLHIWDREFDSRLLMSIIISQFNNNKIILGHEYNMLPLVGKNKYQFMYRTGHSENTYRSTWDLAIQSTGGVSILQDEEGINNIPLTITKGQGCKQIDLCKEKVTLRHSVTKNIVNRSKQIAWSPMHKRYLTCCMKDQESQIAAEHTIYEGSGIRFDILGRLGAELYKKEIDALNTTFDDYILVLDNFSVDQSGGKDSGLVDPKARMREIGYTDREIEEYILKAESDRQNEVISRKNFSDLIKDISNTYTNCAIIVRPHPALYPGYWKVEFADNKNIFVIGKGNVQPWIYGSLLTIQSGCTTALEAIAAGTQTIDVSSIIGERTEAIEHSLAAQTKNKPFTMKELYTTMADCLKSSQQKKRYKPRVFNFNTSSNAIEDIFLEVISQNSREIRQNITDSLGIANGDHVIGKCSGMTCLLKILSTASINTQPLDYKELVGHHPPNTNKSRLVGFSEIHKKTSQFVKALKELGLPIKLIRLNKLSTNLIMLTSE